MGLIGGNSHLEPLGIRPLRDIKVSATAVGEPDGTPSERSTKPVLVVVEVPGENPQILGGAIACVNAVGEWTAQYCWAVSDLEVSHWADALSTGVVKLHAVSRLEYDSILFTLKRFSGRNKEVASAYKLREDGMIAMTRGLLKES